ncbi:hypothetical protein ACFS5N_16260 [Mucilaginibacter ximonensis]|uniref:Uncharacterized protein n=1 Tax=Mucilaginibacter ximonensis TaxID=538021 RepID=A0ABW5YGT7_9SPHI
MTQEQLAARALLEHGMKVPARAPSLLRAFGKKEISILIPPPTLGTLYRVDELVEASGMTALIDDQSVNIHEARRRFTKPLSLAIAICISNGSAIGWLVRKPLAWWLREHLQPLHLLTVGEVIEALRLDKAFLNTTRSVIGMKMTRPNLGQTAKGS